MAPDAHRGSGPSGPGQGSRIGVGAGGEPLIHPEVHLDGLRERHDASVDHAGTFNEAVEAIRESQRRGFRVTTNTTFFNTGAPQTVREVLDFLNDDLRVDQMMISPAYAYWKAPDQEHFLGVEQTRQLFRQAFADGHRRRWRLNHSPLFLDFLEGKADFSGTAWGIPELLGLRLAAPLLPDERQLRQHLQGAHQDHRLAGVRAGSDPRCANSMAHCGYEPTAVLATMGR